MSAIDFFPDETEVNFNIASDIITDTIRVSTAGIWLSHDYGAYLQYETWVFSKDPSQRSIQVIHGTKYRECDQLKKQALKIHGYLVANMKAKINPPFN